MKKLAVIFLIFISINTHASGVVAGVAAGAAIASAGMSDVQDAKAKTNGTDFYRYVYDKVDANKNKFNAICMKYENDELKCSYYWDDAENAYSSSLIFSIAVFVIVLICIWVVIYYCVIERYREYQFNKRWWIK